MSNQYNKKPLKGVDEAFSFSAGKHLPAAPAARLTGGALVILTVLSAGAPPIALAISYGSSSSQPQGAALRGQSGLSNLERYYESSVPDSIAAAIWFTGTTKKSHAYVTVIDGFIILDHEDPGRASDRTRSSYWLVQPGSIHESLVQLSLGDTVEKYHAWLPPVLSFSRSHPERETA
ncbi:hypothetical protein ACOSQ2_003257 [Xanthoceras sorbifolium]